MRDIIIVVTLAVAASIVVDCWYVTTKKDLERARTELVKAKAELNRVKQEQLAMEQFSNFSDRIVLLPRGCNEQ